MYEGQTRREWRRGTYQVAHVSYECVGEVHREAAEEETEWKGPLEVLITRSPERLVASTILARSARNRAEHIEDQDDGQEDAEAFIEEGEALFRDVHVPTYHKVIHNQHRPQCNRVVRSDIRDHGEFGEGVQVRA